MRATMNKNLPSRLVRWALLAGVSLSLLGCPTDSPTAPNQVPTSPDGTPSGSWVVTITGSGGSLETNGAPSTLTISIRRASNNELPADGATASILTTLGRFDDPVTGPTTGFLSLVGGVAQVRLFPGDTPGTALVQAQIEESVGSLSISVLPSQIQEFLVTGVTPSEGGTTGGEEVDVMGGGFVEPIRVFFGSSPAEILSVANDLIRVLTPTGSAGFSDVSVTRYFGSAEEETFDFFSGFLYRDEGPEIASIDPLEGPYTGGTTFRIYGTGFEAPLFVDIGGARQEVISIAGDGERITAKTGRIFPIGCSDEPGQVTVTLRDSGLTAFGPDFKFLVEAQAPEIDSVAPTEIAFDFGGVLTVRGRRLGNSSATVGGFSVPVTQISQRELKLDPSVFPDSFFDTLSCPAASPRSTILVPTSASVTVRSDDTMCEDTFNLAVLVLPDTDKDSCDDAP